MFKDTLLHYIENRIPIRYLNSYSIFNHGYTLPQLEDIYYNKLNIRINLDIYHKDELVKNMNISIPFSSYSYVIDENSLGEIFNNIVLLWEVD